MSSKKKTNTTTASTSTNTGTTAAQTSGTSTGAAAGASAQLNSNTTQALNPSWVTDSVRGVQGKIDGLLGADPSTMVAGPSALQNQAFGQAGSLATSPLYGQAATMANEVAGKGPVQLGPVSTVTGASLLDGGLERYYNPYQQQVIDTTMASSDAADERTRAQQSLDIARNQKFGGSGSAITRALTEAELQRGRSSTEANLRSAGFDRATSLGVSDADRRQGADIFSAGAKNTFATQQASMEEAALARQAQMASLLGNLGQAEGADNRANIGLLGEAGAQQRGITQDQLSAPTDLLKLVSALNSGQNYGLFSGQTSTGSSMGAQSGTQSGSQSGTQSGTTTSTGTGTGNSSTVESGGGLAQLLSGLGALGQGAGAMGLMFPSDVRLKTDIHRIGEDAKGRNVYRFRYTADASRKVFTGYMAQELLRSDPEAVGMMGDYLAVDYDMLERAA
jgi:hypothetical protein